MNTGALITAIGSVFTVVAGTLVGYFVVRTDRASKMNRASMEDQQYVLSLVGALRDDYWAVLDWALSARLRFNTAVSKLVGHGDTSETPLPEIPEPKHRRLEARHAEQNTSTN